MNRTFISEKYARALGESIENNNELEAVVSELEAFIELFHKHPELAQLVGNRAIPREKRREVLEPILEQLELKAVTRGFLMLLVERERVGLLEPIHACLARLVDLRLNRAEALVTTVVPLSDEQRERVRVRLSELTGKTIRLKEEQNPDIIGGVIVQIGTAVIDGSVKSSLVRMRNELVPEACEL